MLRRWLVFLLIAESAAYVALAMVLFRDGWQTGWIVLKLLAIALAWRWSHAFTSYLATALLRIRDGRRDAGALRALWGEFVARLTSFNVAQPFEQWVMPDEPALVVAQGGKPHAVLPMLLVHGYLSNRGMWAQFRQRMLAAVAQGKIYVGPIYTLTFESPFSSIDVLAEQLHARIEFICQDTGQSQLHLVCHSMGGLVARAYMAKHGVGRILRLVTLGTPHHGTRLGALGIGTSSRQMRWNGPWLTALAVTEQAVGQAMPPTISIYTLNDDLVYPPESSRLDWAENIAVQGVGHVGLLNSDDVIKLVVQAIKTNVQHPRGVQDGNG